MVKSVIDYTRYVPRGGWLFRYMREHESMGDLYERIVDYVRSQNVVGYAGKWSAELIDIGIRELNDFNINIEDESNATIYILNIKHKNPLIADYCLWKIGNIK